MAVQNGSKTLAFEKYFLYCLYLFVKFNFLNKTLPELFQVEGHVKFIVMKIHTTPNTNCVRS